MNFFLGKPLDLEESMTCEFKEVKGQNPVQAISKNVDQYAVAYLNESGGSIYWGVRDYDHVVLGVPLDHGKRDELRQVVGQKLGAIAPPIPPGSYELPFHPVMSDAESFPHKHDVFVVEMQVRARGSNMLYLTGSGEAYRKTLGGKKKLSGAELLMALLRQLEKKQELEAASPGVSYGSDLSLFPAVSHRAKHIRPLIDGSRILWVDDNPRSTFYERTTLATLGISIDVATSTEEALFMTKRIPFDAIISDIKHGTDDSAGITLLDLLRARNIRTPLIFYIGAIDHTKPKPIGSFAITNLAAELFHYLFDVLERRLP
jgi:CheY-like chemotaxis protein